MYQFVPAMIRTVIVDDEQSARENLSMIFDEHYTGRLKVVGAAASAIEAVALIRETKPDLVFLDVEMPKGDGFELIRAFPDRDFQVIFVTSYRDYAIQAVREQAFDFLVKPIDLDDLDHAVEKLETHLENRSEKEPALLLPVAMQEGTVYLRIDNIVRIEADRNYSTLYKDDGQTFVSSRNLKHFAMQLDERFFRAHHSHLIHLGHVVKLVQSGGLVEMSDGARVPLAKRRKEEFTERMRRLT